MTTPGEPIEEESATAEPEGEAGYDPELNDPEDNTTGAEMPDEEGGLPEESEAEIDDFDDSEADKYPGEDDDE